MKSRNLISIAVFLIAFTESLADPHIWDNGNKDGLWTTAANWDPDGVPEAGDTATFDSSCKSNCLATDVSNNLASITLASGYTGVVTFAQNFVEGGDSLTVSGDLTVNGGNLLCAGDNDGNPANGEGIIIMASNILVGAGGVISADGQGFTNSTGPGAGIAGGGNGGSGASYGGIGGRTHQNWGAGVPSCPPGRPYGSVTAPLALGSGGGNGSAPGGTGGGAVKLVASSLCSVSGTVTCCGLSGGSRAGGGSGGSVWIETATFAGDGTVKADGGGMSSTGTNDYGGGGSGGRIRINFATNLFTGAISSKGGNGGDDGGGPGWPGTYSFPDNTNLTVKGDIALASGDYNIPVLIVTNGATLCFQGDASTTYGAGVMINCSTLSIEGTSRITADVQGFTNNVGPGAGSCYSGDHGTGGSYGGLGGVASQTAGEGSVASHSPGTRYGLFASPTALGSGGGDGTYHGGWGGGAIKLVVSGTMKIDGTVSADGESACYGGGGGSGGSVWIETSTLTGTGTVSAAGGAATTLGSHDHGGGGGGGRIRINWNASTFTGIVRVPGGTGGDNGGRNGWPGTYNFPDNTNLTVKGDLALASGNYNIPILIVTNSATLSFQGDTSTTYGTGVTVNCTDVLVATGASISCNGQGFTNGAGPGAGVSSGSDKGGGGGGYGGKGGRAVPGQQTNTLGGLWYGSSTSPTALGSCGGNNASLPSIGGAGAGAIGIAASGIVRIDGSITANGSVAGYRSGGGSGGSVWIQCATLTGNGGVSADGGDGSALSGNDLGGGGGGGRIRISAAQNTYMGTISAKGGVGGDDGGWAGHPGTYSFDDNRSVVVRNDIALAPGVYNIPYLLVTNGATLSCQGSTNTVNGSGVVVNASVMIVTTGSTVSAVGEGFAHNSGPGKGANGGGSGGGGGGYGGAGGNGGGGAGGGAYGSTNEPTALGSGGGDGDTEWGGWGSGAIKLFATARTLIDGAITAEGERSGFRAGAGSGGSIWIRTRRLEGQGTITADGGNVMNKGTSDNGGGGGGGRIMIDYVFNEFTGTVSAAGGARGDDLGGQDGQAGTVYYKQSFMPATLIILR